METAKKAGKYLGENNVDRATCSTDFSPERIKVAVPWTELKNLTVRDILLLADIP